MKIVGHILILFVLFCSLKAFGSERLVDQLGNGPIEVLIDQESGSISINNYKVDGSFLIEKKNFTKGGEDYKAPIALIVRNNKLIIDLDHVQGLIFRNGDILKVRELVDFVLSGDATTNIGDPTGTHGGGK